MMLSLAASVLLSASSPQEWAGTVTFSEPSLKTVDVPMNLTLTTGTTLSTATTAAISWYFTQNAASRPCIYHPEVGLRWSTDAATATATAEGNGVDPTFYSFDGTLVEENGVVVAWNGTVYHPPFTPGSKTNTPCGSFTVMPTNKQRPPTCKPAPRPAPPPPPPSPPLRRNPRGVWPAPKAFVAASLPSAATHPTIDPARLSLHCSAPAGVAAICNTHIAPAFQRGKVWAFPAPNIAVTGATLNTVAVVVLGEGGGNGGGHSVPALQFGVNESYTLYVNGSHAVITAPNHWGAMYGLESFFQLVQLRESSTGVGGAAVVGGGGADAPFSYGLAEGVPLTINDAPFVRWRGLMIDTARHFLSVPLIKRAIEAMAAAKMNDLHWPVVGNPP